MLPRPAGFAFWAHSRWGYANNNQYVGDNILLSYDRSGTLAQDFKNDPQVGLEAGYSRQLGERNGQKWGIEAAFSYLNLDLGSRGIADPNVLGVDAFPLPVDPNTGRPVVPPIAPYAQPDPRGPGALIGDTLPRDPVTIVSDLDAAIYGFKVGPYFEYPLAQRVSLTVSGGFALLIADSSFRVRQSVSIASPLSASGTLTRSEVGVLPGAYVGGRLSLAVSDSAAVFTGLQYESTGHHAQSLGNKRVEIDFWNAVYWTFGFSYSF